MLDRSVESANQLRRLVRLVAAEQLDEAQTAAVALLESSADGFLLLMTLADWVVAPYRDCNVVMLRDTPEGGDPRIVASAVLVQHVVQDLLDGRDHDASVRLSQVAEGGKLATLFVAAHLLNTLAEQAHDGVQSFEAVLS